MNLLKNSQTNWKYILTVVILAIIVGGGILGYRWWMEQKEIKAPEVKLLEVKIPEEGLPEEIPFWKSSIEVFTKPKPSWEVRTDIFDIFIKDEKSGEETFLMRLDKVYASHYHFAEYHNGNLYIIREFGYNPQTMTYSEDYTRELWRYDKEGGGKKLFSAKGIDFRVDPKEKFVAMESGDVSIGEILTIIDPNTSEIKLRASAETLIHPDLSRDIGEEIRGISIGLDYWSGDGRFFWGDLFFTAHPQQFFKVDTTNWKIIKYNVSSLHLNSTETSFNPNFEKIVYSNAPAVFDVESAEEFKQSQQPVTLYLYDLNSEEKEVIDTSVAEWFNPKWLDNNTIEYTKGGERTTWKLDKTIE